MRPSPGLRGHARRLRSAGRGWPGWRWCVLLAAVGVPGARRELQPAVEPVAGGDGPVAAGLALCEAVPVGVGCCGGGAAEGDTCHAEDGAGQRELRDGPAGIGGLAMASAHVGRFLSARAYEVSCRVRTEEVVRPLRSSSVPASPQGLPRERRAGPPGKRPAGAGCFRGRPVGSPVSCPLWIVCRDNRTSAGQEFGAAGPGWLDQVVRPITTVTVRVGKCHQLITRDRLRFRGCAGAMSERTRW